MSEYKNPVCRGSYMLGTACGRCERCIEENPVSKIEALKSENQSLRAEIGTLKDELDRTTDALIHQGKTLRKTTENLLKMSNNKDAEIQRLREALDHCYQMYSLHISAREGQHIPMVARLKRECSEIIDGKDLNPDSKGGG